jgi:hypothetical protein
MVGTLLLLNLKIRPVARFGKKAAEQRRGIQPPAGLQVQGRPQWQGPGRVERAGRPQRMGPGRHGPGPSNAGAASRIYSNMLFMAPQVVGSVAVGSHGSQGSSPTSPNTPAQKTPQGSSRPSAQSRI